MPKPLTGNPWKGKTTMSNEAYRQNVLAVIVDDKREKVLVFRRVGPEEIANLWQFPQGGLDAGETPEQGLLRELEEEIGTSSVEILSRLEEPLRYDFPPEIKAMLQDKYPDKGNYKGQEQHWFLARLTEGTEKIHFDHQPQEFDACQWVTPEQALGLVVGFKQNVYREGLEKLGLL